MTDSLRFRVRSSSSEEIYVVEATLAPSLRIACTCQAGLNGTLCKHRTAILLGDVTSVVEVNPADVERLGAEAAKSPVAIALRDLENLEADAERIKKSLAAKKKQLARLMSGS